MKRCSNLQ